MRAAQTNIGLLAIRTAWRCGVGGVLLALAAVAAAAQQQALTVPSGQPVSRLDILLEDHPEFAESWLVLRFLTPRIARATGGVTYAQASPDMDYLCQHIGLTVAAEMGGQVDLIVVSLLDQPLARGATNPDVTQFMGAYRVTDAGCEWE